MGPEELYTSEDQVGTSPCLFETLQSIQPALSPGRKLIVTFELHTGEGRGLFSGGGARAQASGQGTSCCEMLKIIIGQVGASSPVI